MMGMLTTMGGVFSLIIGLLITWLIATPLLSDYHRYAYIFILGGITLLMTIIGIRLVKDPKPIQKPEKLDVKKFYVKIPSIIKLSKPLQYVLIARIPSYIGFAAMAFVIVFGVNALSLSEAQTSWLVYANIIGGLISGVVLGEASRLFGNKSNILICNIGVIIALGMAISLAYYPGLGYIWLFATCVIASFTLNNWFGYLNYFLDISPAEERSSYQILGQVVGIPFSFAGFAMGAVVDRFGYITMFVICGVFAVISVLLSIKLLSKKKIALLMAEHGTELAG
jgi:MFS family permease